MLNALEPRGHITFARLPAEPNVEDGRAGIDHRAQAWPLRDDWPAAVQAALPLRPLTVHAGDDLCSMTLHLPAVAGEAACSLWFGPMPAAPDPQAARRSRGMAVQAQFAAGDDPASAAPRPATAGAADSPRATKAVALGSDAVLEVLRHVRRAGVAMAATFDFHGMRLRWQGALQDLSARRGCAVVTGQHMQLQWSEVAAALQACVLRQATSAGLLQTLALHSPAGDSCLWLQPAPSLRVAAHPQPCAWRTALEEVQGGHSGNAC